MILTVTPNPCVDKTVFLDQIELGAFMRAPRYSCIPGGKGTNVSRALKTMGCATRAMVIVGGHTGRHVVDMIEHDDKVPCVPAWVASPTRTITTVLEESTGRQTAFFEPGSAVTAAEFEQIVEVFREAVKGAKAVTLNGTVSDPAIRALYARLIPMARDAGALVFLDSHGPEFKMGLEAGPAFVLPNEKEAAEAVGFELRDEPSRMRAAREMLEYASHGVIVTLGAGGALAVMHDGAWQATPPAIEEVNPVGSGDAFLAGAALGIVQGSSPEAWLQQACAMGAANAASWDIGHFDAATVGRLQEKVQVRRIA